MTVNYYIKCPTCNTITHMRTPAGYIYKTPVRIHCGKCNTLLTGEFVSDNEKEKAYYNMNPGWDTEDAIEHAGNAEWGYSCCNIPEITTTMRHGAVFFSNNRNLTLMNTDIRRIVAMIKPFSEAKNLKIATALYQLTIHSEDAYTTVAQISDKSGVSPEKVQDCLESDLSQFILEKEGPESQFRFEGMYMNILPIISLFDFK